MPVIKRDTNLPKPRNEETQPSIDATESDVPLVATDGYEKSVSEYYTLFSFSRIMIDKF